MDKNNNPNIENYIKILSIFIDSSSITKLKQVDGTFYLKKYSKLTIIENKDLENSFCILIYGAIRHYIISNNKTEQTLRFTLSGNMLCQYQPVEYLCCISECIILSIPNSVLEEIGEYAHLKAYTQNTIQENLKFEVNLLRTSPEERYKKLCEQYQYIFLLVPLKYIASFLGITPQALCRIRKRLLTT